MFKISVTTLESFRRYMREVSPVDTEDSLIEKLAGRFVGNPKTWIGSAFHKIIDSPDCMEIIPTPLSHCQVILEEKGLPPIPVYFSQPQAQLALDYRAAHPSMIHEVPIWKVYDVPKYGEIMVSGKVDGIYGREIHDVKVKFRPMNTEEYLDSAQWRFYADILGLDICYFNIFEIKGLSEDRPFQSLNACMMEAQDPIRCDRYLNLGGDCLDLIAEFMEYIEGRNFYHLLKQTQAYEQNPLF
jgi:hypothetical protein